MQEAEAQAPHSPVSYRDSCAGDQSGVLHHTQCLPAVSSISIPFPCHLLVWLDPLDVLEHSKYHQ